MKSSLLKEEDSSLLFAPFLTYFNCTVQNETDFESQIQILCREIAYITKVDRIGVWFFDTSKCNLYARCLLSFPDNTVEEQGPIALSLFPEYWSLIRNSKVISSNAPQKDSRFQEFWERYLKKKNIKSIVTSSIWSFGEVTAVLSGSTILNQKTFAPEELSIFGIASEIISHWLYQLNSSQLRKEQNQLPPFKSFVKSLLTYSSETLHSSPKKCIENIVETTKKHTLAHNAYAHIICNHDVDTFPHKQSNKHISAQDIYLTYKLVSKTKYLWLPRLDIRTNGVPEHIERIINSETGFHLVIPFECTYKKNVPQIGVLVLVFEKSHVHFKKDILERAQYAVESIKTVLHYIRIQSISREGIEIARAAFEHSTVGMILLNKNAEIIRYNHAAQNIFGFTYKKRENIYRYLSDEYIKEEILFLNQGEETSSFRIETTLNTNTNTQKKVILHISPICIDTQHARYTLIQIIDITEKEKALRDLANQKLFFKSVIDSNPNFIFAKDINGKFLLANKAVAEAYGTTEENLIGKTDSDFNKNEIQVKKFIEDDLYVINNKKELHLLDEEITDYQGNKRVLCTVKKPLFSEERNQYIVLGVSTDITTRKKAEEEYKEWLYNLEHSQKLESLGLLASGVAHDFNNILQGVIGNASLALELVDANSKIKDLTDNILFSAQRAAEITNQLLHYTGKGSYQPIYVDAKDLVIETFKMIDRIMEKKAIIRYENCIDDLPILADKPKMHQVILNLITNAVESLPNNSGKVLVSTKRINIYTDEIIPHNGENKSSFNFARIQVKDTGIGISKEHIKKIFEPFFTTKDTGRGIGLSAVQGIVKSHGGILKVDSEQGKGTTFSVLIPLSDTKTTSPPKLHMNPPTYSFKNKHILVIDDEFITREVCISMLTHLEFHAIEASNGMEGIQKFKTAKQTISCIILDLTMPKMDGKEVFQKIRELSDSIPIIFSSGYSEHQLSFNIKSCKNTYFIQKPFTMHDFKKSILEALHSSQYIASL